MKSSRAAGKVRWLALLLCGGLVSACSLLAPSDAELTAGLGNGDGGRDADAEGGGRDGGHEAGREAASEASMCAQRGEDCTVTPCCSGSCNPGHKT